MDANEFDYLAVLHAEAQPNETVFFVSWFLPSSRTALCPWAGKSTRVVAVAK
jgi:hypothetical protein